MREGQRGRCQENAELNSNSVYNEIKRRNAPDPSGQFTMISHRSSLGEIQILYEDAHPRAFTIIHKDIAIIMRFSVSEIKPSGTLLPPPTQAQLMSRFSI